MEAPLLPGKYYHIFNHANGKENLFVNEGNYLFFLKRFANYINPIAGTMAYCLMPNHFHFVVRIKTFEEIEALDSFQEFGRHLNPHEKHSNFLSRQFARLFSSYAQAFNKQQNRMGSLFIPNFKRKLIEDDDYLKNVIHYTHFNPVHHRFTTKIQEWQHSSFKSFATSKNSHLLRKDALNLFGGIRSFYQFHNKYFIDDLMIAELENY